MSDVKERTSKEITEELRKAQKMGLTAAQAAAVVGVTLTYARRKAKKAGFVFVDASSAYWNAIRDTVEANKLVAKQKAAAAREKKARKACRNRVEDVKRQLAEISSPHERYEFAYGAALLAFERRQVKENKRPELLCDGGGERWPRRAIERSS
jgi:hypothetical protein